VGRKTATRILMFGDNVEIIEPLEVRKEIGQKIHNMFVKYHKS
jgi:predicted DNA-binding transcriptional regulator YafY